MNDEMEPPPLVKDMILLADCPDCGETDHIEDGDERCCMDCGRVNQYIDWDSYTSRYYWRERETRQTIQ
jgi:hypothetical protein